MFSLQLVGIKDNLGRREGRGSHSIWTRRCSKIFGSVSKISRIYVDCAVATCYTTEMTNC